MTDKALRRVIRFVLGVYHTYFLLYASIWDIQHPNYRTYAGRWKTLTFVTCMLNCWYFIGASLQEFLFSLVLPDALNKKIKSLLDIVFGAVICPAALLVVGAFWGLFYWKRALIWPESMDEVIPQTYGHMMHSFLAVFALLELIVFNHQYPSFNTGFAICMIFAGCYVSWLYLVRYVSGIWAYPILYKLTSPWNKEMFIGGVVSLLMALYCIQHGLHHTVHGTNEEDYTTKEDAVINQTKNKKSKKVE